MDSGMTLIELLASMSITLVLTVLLLPSIQYALVRANVSKVMIDMNSIKNALNHYYADHSDYPSANDLLSHISKIDEIDPLITPYPYLSSFPQLPWLGKEGINIHNPEKIEHQIQRNYRYSKEGVHLQNFNIPLDQIGWFISSGGPVSITWSGNPKYWYTPSNGLLSWGCFYMDSFGKTNSR